MPRSLMHVRMSVVLGLGTEGSEPRPQKADAENKGHRTGAEAEPRVCHLGTGETLRPQNQQPDPHYGSGVHRRDGRPDTDRLSDPPPLTHEIGRHKRLSVPG